MTKMATMPIYGKDLLLWNQKADDLETWYSLTFVQGHTDSKFFSSKKKH